MRPTKIAAAAAVVASMLFAIGCSGAPDEEDEAPDQSELRADPNSVVSTFAPSVHLLEGYNPLLDRSTSRCVDQPADARADVGDERSNYYLHSISTSEELAKELEIDVSAASNVPTVDASAALGLVRTFKQSSNKVSFLLRAVRSYQVSAKTPAKMTERGTSLARTAKPETFALECGGSYIKAIRYEAQVLAILEFEASSVEDARKIRASITASAPTSPVNGSAGVKASIQTAAKSHAFTSQIVTSGFSAHGAATTDDPAKALAAFDTLTSDMNKSVDADVDRDRAGYFGNDSRIARPVSLTQGSYAAIPGAPDAARFRSVTTLLGKSEKFYSEIASLLARVEYVYANEQRKFLDDTRNQHRYNLVSGAMSMTTPLIEIARVSSKGFRADDPSTIAGKLKAAADRCLELAGNGDYSGCREGSAATELHDASVKLEYYPTDRIVEMAAHAPTGTRGELTKVSYRNAEPTCRAAGMRLPTDEEARMLTPMLRALGGPTAEMWLAANGTCSAPYFGVSERGFGADCDNRSAEALPYIGDRAMICVPPSGPIPTLREP